MISADLSLLTFFINNRGWESFCLTEKFVKHDGSYQKINRSNIKIPKKCSDFAQTTLHWIFSCALLPGAPRATLHRVFTCALLSQEF